MCGLHGIVTTDKRVANADDFIAEGFVTGSLRGTDASGIASIDMVQGQVELQKLPVSGPFFTGDKYARKLILAASSNYQITMCHTRASTSGPSGINAAHPFIVEDETTNRVLVGCHNGTLSGWSTKEDGAKFNVDSEWALNRIFKKGADAFKEFNGAYCFTFWDSDLPNCLHIALNDERPMFVAFSEEGCMAYASELGMLWWLMERNKIKIKGKALKLVGRNWYTFNADTPSTLEKWHKQELPAAQVVTTARTQGSTYSHYGTGYTYESHAEKVDKVLQKISTGQTSQPNQALIAMSQASTAANGGIVEVNPDEYADNPLDGEYRIVNEDLVAGKSTRVVITNADEIKLARQMDLMGVEGDFVPTRYDEQTGEMGGYWTSESRIDEFNAVIRKANDLEHDIHPYSLWKVKLIGLNDTGNELIAVCSKPRFLGVDTEAISEELEGTTIN
jgi:asparagine synthetase B (glutamine-hydrolysing)